MRRPEMDYVLTTMLDSQPDVSDLNFTVDKPPQVESFGELRPVTLDPFIEKLTPFQTEMIALNIIGENQWHFEDLLKRGSCDVSYSLSDQARFRCNIFSQRGNFSIVCRKLNTEIPTLEWLQFPEIFKQIPREKTGLVLVTGATGSGKSTTLAAVLSEINKSKPVHIVTLEDPVEYVHPQRAATFNQRELGQDFNSFVDGLRAALRQAPKVILVGEMRDRETVSIALSAAETGHLVLSTLHTIDAGQTVNRILGMFEPEEQEQIRARLADSLRWVVSQRLVPKIGGGRFALLELMGSNLRTQESIRLGESEGKSFYEIIEASHPFGWRTFDHSAFEAYEQGKITEDTALLYCTKRGPVTRNIDNLKKSRGESTTSIASLRMKTGADAGQPGGSPIPPVLENQARMNDKFDFVSATDKPALLAFSTPDWLEAARAALQELGYKVHTAATHSDFLVRFSQIHYHLVMVEERFAANSIEENTTLRALQTMPMSQRRHATILLFGESFQTFTPMQAFQQSVHAVINSSEMFLLKQLIEKAVADNLMFLHSFREVQGRVHSD